MKDAHPMRGLGLAFLAAVAGGALPTDGAAMQFDLGTPNDLEVRIWLDRGVDPVLQRGDEATVYYRASVDAHLVLFHINTDGVLRVLFPGTPNQSIRAAGGTDYRLLFPASDVWTVEDTPGVGYFFVLASRTPFQFDDLSRTPVAGGWASTPDRNRISLDPYVVVSEFTETLLSNADEQSYAVDFTEYHVGQSYSYPRFLCYQCHTAPDFAEWNPYLQTCPEVRVVIYNDPYFYPATRYQGGAIVYPRPPEPGLPQFVLSPRQLGEAGVPVVRSRSAVRTVMPASPFNAALDPQPAGDDFLTQVGQGAEVGSREVSSDLPAVSTDTGDPGRQATTTGSGAPPPPPATPSPRPIGADGARPILRRRSSNPPAAPSR